MCAIDEINKGMININGLKSPIIDPSKYQFVIFNYSDYAEQSIGRVGALNLIQNDNVAVIVGQQQHINYIPSLSNF